MGKEHATDGKSHRDTRMKDATLCHARPTPSSTNSASPSSGSSSGPSTTTTTSSSGTRPSGTFNLDPNYPDQTT